MNIDLTHNGSIISVIGRNPRDGSLGIALASTSMAIGSRCPHIDLGRVAVVSQGFTNLKVGPLALDLVRGGLSAHEVMEALRQHDRWLDHRQIGIVTADGRIEAHTGAMTAAPGGHVVGENVLCLGNGLTRGVGVLDEAVESFTRAVDEPLPERLLRALERGKAVLGDAFPITSSSLLVRSTSAESQIDLRVDMSRVPTEEGGNALADLRFLYEQYRPLLDVYAARSVAPRSF